MILVCMFLYFVSDILFISDVQFVVLWSLFHLIIFDNHVFFTFAIYVFLH